MLKNKPLILILCLACLIILSDHASEQGTANSGYKVTGSGMNYPEAPSWATLGVNIDTLNLQDSWLRYYYPNMKLNLISTSIAGVTVEGGTVKITGTGTVHGNEGFTFTATINDGSPDAFGIEIRNPEGTFYYTGEVKPVVRGNFVISSE